MVILSVVCIVCVPLRRSFQDKRRSAGKLLHKRGRQDGDNEPEQPFGSATGDLLPFFLLIPLPSHLYPLPYPSPNIPHPTYSLIHVLKRAPALFFPNCSCFHQRQQLQEYVHHTRTRAGTSHSRSRSGRFWLGWFDQPPEPLRHRHRCLTPYFVVANTCFLSNEVNRSNPLATVTATGSFALSGL